MAEGGDKTEKPTPKQRDKARKEGRVAKSMEVNSTAVLLATLAALAVTGPRLLAACEQIMAGGLSRTSDPGIVDESGVHALMTWGITAVLTAIGPVVAVAMAAGILA